MIINHPQFPLIPHFFAECVIASKNSFYRAVWTLIRKVFRSDAFFFRRQPRSRIDWSCTFTKKHANTNYKVTCQLVRAVNQSFPSGLRAIILNIFVRCHATSNSENERDLSERVAVPQVCCSEQAQSLLRLLADTARHGTMLLFPRLPPAPNGRLAGRSACRLLEREGEQRRVADAVGAVGAAGWAGRRGRYRFHPS